MAGIIVTTPPTVELPPGNNTSNPSSLVGLTYNYALSISPIFTGTATFQGAITTSVNISFTANTIFAAGTFYKSSTTGITIGGATGSDSDFVIAAASGYQVFDIPTGTHNVRLGKDGGTTIIAGNATVAGTLTVTPSEQHITAAGPVTINNGTTIVRVDQAAGAPIVLTMGLASAKTCPVLISDWKGDAATNNITINLSGSDTFPGGLTSWVIAANTASLFLTPVSGVGYTI